MFLRSLKDQTKLINPVFTRVLVTKQQRTELETHAAAESLAVSALVRRFIKHWSTTRYFSKEYSKIPVFEDDGCYIDIRTTAITKRGLKRAAKQQGITLSTLLRKIIVRALDEYDSAAASIFRETA